MQRIDRGADRRALEGRPRHRAHAAASRACTLRRGDGEVRLDKPDLRFELPLVDLTEVVAAHDGGGVGLLRVARSRRRAAIVKALARCPPRSAEALSRADARQARGVRQGLRRARPGARARRRGRRLDAERRCKTITRGAAPRDQRAPPALSDGRPAVPAVRRARSWCNAVLGGAAPAPRREARPHPAEGDGGSFCWVTDFPLFEVRRGRAACVAAHHPFTSPRADDLELPRERSRHGARARLRPRAQRQRDRAAARSVSIAPTCRRACSARSASATRTRSAKFGFLLEAFKYGPPPHGGIAARRRSPGDAPLRRRVAARRDRVPEDAEGHRPDDRRARGRCRSGSSTSCTSRSRNDDGRPRARGRDAARALASRRRSIC